MPSINVDLLISRIDCRLIGCDQQRERLTDIVAHFQRTREGTSLVLVGARFSGKSTLLHTVLADVGKDRALRIVRLSGQVHSTDRLALRQLNVDDVADWQMADRSKSTIVIVDQLEMFAQRGNQILLYKLLDACQQNSVLFIGVSSRHDVIDLFEKRVRSRFSNTIIQMSGSIEKFDEYRNTAVDLLSIVENATWNKRVKMIFKQMPVRQCLHAYHDANNTLSALKRFLAVLLSSIEDVDDLTVESVFAAVNILLPTDDRAIIICESLNVLELTLLICICKMVALHQKDQFTYTSVIEHYRRFMHRHERNMTIPTECVLIEALDQLTALSLIAPTSKSQQCRLHSSPFRAMELQIDTHLIDTVVDRYQPMPAFVKQLKGLKTFD